MTGSKVNLRAWNLGCVFCIACKTLKTRSCFNVCVQGFFYINLSSSVTACMRCGICMIISEDVWLQTFDQYSSKDFVKSKTCKWYLNSKHFLFFFHFLKRTILMHTHIYAHAQTQTQIGHTSNGYTSKCYSSKSSSPTTRL